MRIIKNSVLYLFIFLLGSYSTIGYFLYRSRTEFLPHLQALTGMPDVGMLEVFEWPLDIIFPSIPIFLSVICYSSVYGIIRLIGKLKTEKQYK